MSEYSILIGCWVWIINSDNAYLKKKFPSHSPNVLDHYAGFSKTNVCFIICTKRHEVNFLPELMLYSTYRNLSAFISPSFAAAVKVGSAGVLSYYCHTTLHHVLNSPLFVKKAIKIEEITRIKF